MLIESYLLEQFEAVARCGTLLKASEELHISQPSFNKYAEIGNKECKWFRSINQNYLKFKEHSCNSEITSIE